MLVCKEAIDLECLEAGEIGPQAMVAPLFCHLKDIGMGLGLDVGSHHHVGYLNSMLIKSKDGLYL